MSIFTRIANAIASLAVNIFKRKAKATEILAGLWSMIPEILTFWNSYKGLDAPARVREFWEEFDYRTGIGGVDLLRDLPEEVEERIFDGLKMAGVELSLYAIGYYTNGERPSVESLRQVGDYVSRAMAADTHILLSNYARSKSELARSGSSSSADAGESAPPEVSGPAPEVEAFPPAEGSTMRKGPQL